MPSRQADQAVALAGVYQAAYLVQEIAYRGSAEADALETCLDSVLALDAQSVEAIYGGVAGVATGLRLLRDQIRGPESVRNIELTKYVIALLHLERRLARRNDLVETLREGLRGAAQQSRYFGSSTHETVVARLAELYVDTISTLGPRIMVSGEQQYLSNSDKANTIRALLLAGIRSAVLWRQRGGRRWRLLLSRRRLLTETEQLLEAAVDA